MKRIGLLSKLTNIFLSFRFYWLALPLGLVLVLLSLLQQHYFGQVQIVAWISALGLVSVGLVFTPFRLLSTDGSLLNLVEKWFRCSSELILGLTFFSLAAWLLVDAGWLTMTGKILGAANGLLFWLLLFWNLRYKLRDPLLLVHFALNFLLLFFW